MVNINDYKSHNLKFFATSRRLLDISVSSFVTLKEVGHGYELQNSMVNTMVRWPFDGKYMTSYLMAIIVFAVSLIIYVTFAVQNKIPKV